MRLASLFRPVLMFEDAALEVLWRASIARTNKRNVSDLAYFAFFAAPTLICAFRALQVDNNRLARIVAPTLLVLLYASLCTFIVLRPAIYNQSRASLLTGLKIAYILTSCNVGLVEDAGADTWFQFLRSELLLFQRGFLALIVSVALPQPFLQHCAVQSCLLLLDLLHLPSLCAAFHSRQPSNYGRYKQIVTAVDGMLSMQPGGRSCPLNQCGLTFCMHVQAFLSVVVGFMLSGMLVYALECRCRLKFLQSCPEVRVRHPQGSPKLGRSALLALFYLANTAVAMVLLWHWLGWLLALQLRPYSLSGSL